MISMEVATYRKMKPGYEGRPPTTEMDELDDNCVSFTPANSDGGLGRSQAPVGGEMHQDSTQEKLGFVDQWPEILLIRVLMTNAWRR